MKIQVSRPIPPRAYRARVLWACGIVTYSGTTWYERSAAVARARELHAHTDHQSCAVKECFVEVSTDGCATWGEA